MRDGGDFTASQGFREVMLGLARALSYQRSSVAFLPCENVPFWLNTAARRAIILMPLPMATETYQMLLDIEVLNVAQRISHIERHGCCHGS
jgi:hypothetical protein